MNSRTKALCISLVNANRGDLDNHVIFTLTSKLLSAMNSLLNETKIEIKSRRIEAIKQVLKPLALSVKKENDFWLRINDPALQVPNEINALNEFLKIAAEREKSDFTDQSTKNLLTIFETSDDALRYLSDFIESRQNSKIPLHDACLLEPPDEDNLGWTPAHWKVIIKNNLKHRGNFQVVVDLLKSADRIEAKFKESGDKGRNFRHLQVNELKKYVQTYANQNKHPEAAALFHKHGIEESIFDDYLKLTPIDDDILMPPVTINHGEFTLQKLSSADPRAAILGTLTGCCQSLGAAGRECAIYGIEKPNAGFYVITNRKGKIVSQFFAWRDEKNNFVIDSLESSDVFFNASATIGKDVELVKVFVDELLKPGRGIAAVHIGTGGRTPASLGRAPLIDQCSLMPPNGGKMYRDSKRIRTLGVSDVSLCEHLGIQCIEGWWDEAAKKILSINELIFCLIICPIDHYASFSSQIKGKRVSSNTKDKQTVSNVISALLNYLNETQCRRICDVVDMESFHFDDLAKISESNNKDLFIREYFKANKKRDWDNVSVVNIFTVEQLAYYINQSDESDIDKCYSALFDVKVNSGQINYGSVLNRSIDDDINLFDSRRWGAIGFILSNTSLDKCRLICAKIKRYPLDYLQYISILHTLEDETNKKIFLDDFLKVLPNIKLVMQDVVRTFRHLRPGTIDCILEKIKAKLYVGEGGLIETVSNFNDLREFNTIIDEELKSKITINLLGNLPYLKVINNSDLECLASRFKSRKEEHYIALLFGAIMSDITLRQFKIIRNLSIYRFTLVDMEEHFSEKDMDNLNNIVIDVFFSHPDQLIRNISDFINAHEMLEEDQGKTFLDVMLPKLCSLIWDNIRDVVKTLNLLDKIKRPVYFKANIGKLLKDDPRVIKDSMYFYKLLLFLPDEEVSIILSNLTQLNLGDELGSVNCQSIWRKVNANEFIRNSFFDKIKHSLTDNDNKMFYGLFEQDFFNELDNYTRSWVLLSRLDDKQLSGYFKKLQSFLSPLERKRVHIDLVKNSIQTAPSPVRDEILSTAQLSINFEVFKALLPENRKISATELCDFINITWLRVDRNEVLQWIDAHLNNQTLHYSNEELIQRYEWIMSHPLISQPQVKNSNANTLFPAPELKPHEEIIYFQQKISEIRLSMSSALSASK